MNFDCNDLLSYLIDEESEESSNQSVHFLLQSIINAKNAGWLRIIKSRMIFFSCQIKMYYIKYN